MILLLSSNARAGTRDGVCREPLTSKNPPFTLFLPHSLVRSECSPPACRLSWSTLPGLYKSYKEQSGGTTHIRSYLRAFLCASPVSLALPFSHSLILVPFLPSFLPATRADLWLSVCSPSYESPPKPTPFFLSRMSDRLYAIAVRTTASTRSRLLSECVFNTLRLDWMNRN